MSSGWNIPSPSRCSKPTEPRPITRERSGSVLKGIAPSNVYTCKDGSYMIGANNDAIFARLCQAMGRPEMSRDERYSTHIARGIHQDELDALINDWTGTLTVDEVDALMIEYSIPAGRVYRAPDMLDDPHFKARDAIVTTKHPYFGDLKMQNVAPKLSETPGGIRSSAPTELGEHNAEVYQQLLGFDAARMAALRAAKVI